MEISPSKGGKLITTLLITGKSGCQWHR